MKKYIYIIIGILLFLPIMFIAATGSEEISEENKEANKKEESIFLYGEKIVIDYDVNGDVFVFGTDIVIDGNIAGDVIGAGEKIVINKEIDGNLRFIAGESIEVNNLITRNVTTFSNNFTINNSGSIKKDAYIASIQSMNSLGSINGKLFVATQKADIQGSVGKDIIFYSDIQDGVGLEIHPSAFISGNIEYNSLGQVSGVKEGENVLGELSIKRPEALKQDTASSVLSAISSFIVLIISIFSVIFIGGRGIRNIQKTMIALPARSIGLGALTIFFLPIICIIFFFSKIFLLGFIGIALWILLVLLSFIFSVMSLGEVLVNKFKQDLSGKIYYTAILGALISVIIINIPFLGFLTMAVFLFWGTGGVVIKLLEGRKDDIVIKSSLSENKEVESK